MRHSTDQIDDLARRAFAREPGASLAFGTRLRLRIQGEQAAARRRRTRLIAGSTITALAASVVLVLVLTVNWSRPVPKASTQAGLPAREVPAPKDGPKGEHAQPRPDTQPEPRPPAHSPTQTPGERTPDGPLPEIRERPQPAPDVKPEPGPGPRQTPQPGTEEPPVKPAEVEKPDPATEPPPKTAPRERKELGAVLSLDRAARGKVRYGDTESWREFTPGEKLLDGAQLQAAAPVAFNLGRALLRFEGEIVLHAQDGGCRVELLEDSLYADNLALDLQLEITAGELRARLAGVATFSVSSSGLRLDVLHGRVDTARGAVSENSAALLTRRGLTRRAFMRDARLFKELPSRLVLREELETEPAGGLYSGLIKAGLAVSRGGNDAVAFKFRPLHALLPGEVIRVRFRASKAKSLLVQMFDEKRNDNFGHEVSSWKDGQWQTLEFRPAAMLDRGSGKVKPDVGTEFVNFQFHIEGAQDALLEIDWIEIVRVEE
ncbi:hypothetical protein EDM80_05880 [bacterium]|nr:MAG: hypothetical protein EDM80_05880 [bacterium]RIK63701.1 MAG: hypothetical protein DCC64_06190 [Planctomycetota bacterium]